MAEVILMPRLSDTMTEGVIADWHKNVGDTVKKGDLLAEVETDKATMELESYKDGILLHIGIAKGGKLQVNDLLAIIGTKGEDVSKLIAEHSGSAEKPAETKVEQQKTEVAAESNIKLDISTMDEVVLMPRLSDTMEEGVIASWHKNVGDAVKKGEVLADIETDKATMELESYKNGTLLHIGATQGQKIPVNGLLCIIGDKDKVDVEAIVNAAKAGPQTTATETVKTTVEVAPTNTSDSNNNATSEDGRLKVSPLARKLASEKGIDLKNIQGTGDAGRITKSDIDNFDASKISASSAKTDTGITSAPAFNSVVKGEEGYVDTANTQMRKTIARRLSESKFTAPHFYLTMEINMDNSITARKQMNDVSPVKISFQDMLIKACAMALKLHPAVNSSWMDDFIRTYQHIHIGSAIALPEGLIVPVIRFADQKSLSQLSAESKELYDKARNKKLQPQEFSGNTFTISNLGMMDIDEFTAIVNPPDSCILAVGKIKEIVVKKDEGFTVTNVMKVTLSCDHRSVDGAVGASFLQTLKKYMENPVTMLV